jgi:hypothetical protein
MLLTLEHQSFLVVVVRRASLLTAELGYFYGPPAVFA